MYFCLVVRIDSLFMFTAKALPRHSLVLPVLYYFIFLGFSQGERRECKSNTLSLEDVSGLVPISSQVVLEICGI